MDTREMQEQAQKRFDELHTEGARIYGLVWFSANLAVNRIAQQDYVPTVGMGNIHPAIKCALTECAMVIAKERIDVGNQAEELQADLKAAQAENARLRLALEAIERNAPDLEPLDVHSNSNHPAAYSFWVAGNIAREALQPTEVSDHE